MLCVAMVCLMLHDLVIRAADAPFSAWVSVCASEDKRTSSSLGLGNVFLDSNLLNIILKSYFNLVYYIISIAVILV